MVKNKTCISRAAAAPKAWQLPFPSLVLGILVCLFAVVLVRNAWVSDDAYITFRTVDNFVHGYGLRWNVAERVQTYTHPLWMFLISLFYIFTREPYYTSLVFSFALSVAAVLLIAFKIARSPGMGVLAMFVFIFSKAFMDYSTSGLENPLTHLILVLFVLVYVKYPATPRGIFLLAFLAGLSMLNRMDTILLYLPVLGYSYFRLRQWRGGLLALLGGIAPFILWELFSLFYYGFLFPNTAYAKLGSGIPWTDLVGQGFYYFLDSVRSDPLTLPVIGLGLFLPLLKKDWLYVPFSVGILFYLGYILNIGGDFMSGRFFSPPLVLAVALITRYPWKRSEITILASAGVFLVGLFSPRCPLLSGLGYGMGYKLADAREGITDERAFYYPFTGFLAAMNGSAKSSLPGAVQGRQVRERGIPVMPYGAVGIFGFCAGPKCHVLDFQALGDPLLARMPAVAFNAEEVMINGNFNKPWRIGHFLRALPEGYFETISSGTSKFRDPNMAAYYARLRMVIQNDLFSWKRLAEIWNFNTGKYDQLIDVQAYRYPRRVDLSEVSSPKPEGTPFNASGNFPTSSNGLQVNLKRTYHSSCIEISLSDVNPYLVFVGEGKEGPHAVVLIQPPTELSLQRSDQVCLKVYRITVEPDVAGHGYDRITIYPGLGTIYSSLGHVKLY